MGRHGTDGDRRPTTQSATARRWRCLGLALSLSLATAAIADVAAPTAAFGATRTAAPASVSSKSKKGPKAKQTKQKKTTNASSTSVTQQMLTELSIATASGKGSGKGNGNGNGATGTSTPPTTSPTVTIATVPVNPTTTTVPPTTAPPTTAPPTTAPPTTAPPTTAPPTTAPPTTAPPTTAPPTTVPPAPTRDARLWPFASTSPWNTPIGTAAQYAPTTDPRYANMMDPWSAINAQSWSMPVYLATTSDPIRTVTSQAGSWQYRIPDNAVPSLPTDGDRHMLVIDPTGQYVDECWLASKQADGSWWCEYHVRNDLRGAGVLENGVRAYGGSALGGLIRTWELQQGSIQHALALALPRRDLMHGPVWPASSEDGNATYGGSTPMGSLFAIPRTVNLASLGLSAGGMVIAKALQSYGAYVVDASENFTLFAEPSAENLLTSARADLDKIRAAMRPVTNNTPSTPGGGGTPIVAVAPGLSG
jgi:hypothetical protein